MHQNASYPFSYLFSTGISLCLWAGILPPCFPSLHNWLSVGLFGSSSPFWKQSLFLPSSFSLALRRRSVAGTRCSRMSMPEVAFLMEIRCESLALSVQEWETLVGWFFCPLPFWKIISELMSSVSLMPCGCQIFPQDWFLHLLPHLYCCAISFRHVQLVIMGLSWLFLRFHG